MDPEAVKGGKVDVFSLGLTLLAVTAEAGGFFLVGLGVPIPPFPILSHLPHGPEGLSLQLHPPDRRGEPLAFALDQGNLDIYTERDSSRRLSEVGLCYLSLFCRHAVAVGIKRGTTTAVPSALLLLLLLLLLVFCCCCCYTAAATAAAILLLLLSSYLTCKRGTDRQ